jgi:kynurenine formamidase
MMSTLIPDYRSSRQPAAKNNVTLTHTHTFTSMLASVQSRGVRFDCDLSAPTDCSICVVPDRLLTDQPDPTSPRLASVAAWNTPLPSQKPLQFDRYILDTRQGGSCNANFLHFSPHTAGTHTECIGHITDERFTISHAQPSNTMHLCMVLSVQPVRLGDSGEQYAPGQPDDLVISQAALQLAIDQALGTADEASRSVFLTAFSEALVIRTLPNEESKRTFDYSGTNPVYFTENATRLARALGVKRLICDLPSIDRSDDQGLLLAHRAFWNLSAADKFPGANAPTSTVTGTSCIRRHDIPRKYLTLSWCFTEFAFIPNSVAAGLYLLSLQIAPIELDAAPSRPILFSISNLRQESS